MINNFNLLISSPRYNEENAKAELWFALLICGDKYPIIQDLEFQGLITALTEINEFEVILKIKDLLEEDPEFFQYILKIVPIQYVCETNQTTIAQIIKSSYKQHINQNETFRIKLNRRKNDLIDRDVIIDKCAQPIDNPVDLENADKIVRIEVLGNMTGISYLKKKDIIRIKPKFH